MEEKMTTKMIKREDPADIVKVTVEHRDGSIAVYDLTGKKAASAIVMTYFNETREDGEGVVTNGEIDISAIHGLMGLYTLAESCAQHLNITPIAAMSKALYIAVRENRTTLDDISQRVSSAVSRMADNE